MGRAHLFSNRCGSGNDYRLAQGSCGWIYDRCESAWFLRRLRLPLKKPHRRLVLSGIFRSRFPISFPLALVSGYRQARALNLVSDQEGWRALLVEDVIRQLDDLIVADNTLGPALFEQLRVAQRELGLLQGDRATCPFLRPHVLRRTQYETIKLAAETLAVAFEKIAIEALSDQTLMAFIALTPAEEEAARIEPGYSRLCVSSRLDAHASAKGLQFLEYNAESPAGIGDQMQLEKILFRLPALKHFLKTNHSM